MKPRAFSLDALRGYAIITMILSGQMILTHLPAWMAHAQVPPGKGFDPSIYGITWVDLVFPFFLFAMGAALPFSIGSKIAKGANRFALCLNSFTRAAQLVFFAIFFQHMKPFVISSTQSIEACLISLLSFTLMFFMFMNIQIPRFKNTKYELWSARIIKIAAYLIALVLMNSLQYTGKKTPEFDPHFSDIILIVLGNMAFFGSVCYIFTYKKPLYRIAILPFVMAVFLSSSNEGWVKDLFNYTPLDWAYKFYYLKYLFILIPGSIAGEYLHDWINAKPDYKSQQNKADTTKAYMLTLLSLTLIICNVIFLYTRQLQLNLLVSIALISTIYLLLKGNKSNFGIFWNKLFIAGAYCLMLGLFLEAYEGGIRKDSSTYSYYFVTSGLAFFALLIFSLLCDYLKYIRSTRFLVMIGQNPMIAYVATSLVILPLLTITGLNRYTGIFGNGAIMGFLHGALLTTLSILITMFFTRIKWFWRT